MEDDDELEDQSFRRSVDLKKALRRYDRKKKVREIIFWLVFIGAAAVPVFYGFTRTESVLWYGFIMVAVMFEQNRKRVRAMQVRLATMQGQLDHLVGEHGPIENVLLELSEV
jgi:hypothetical protein